MAGWIVALWIVTLMVAAGYFLSVFFLSKIKSGKKLSENIPALSDWEDTSNIKEIPLEQFNELFEKHAFIIEKDTYGWTESIEEWMASDARVMIPKGYREVVIREGLARSYATKESFMCGGKVYVMERTKAQIFPNWAEAETYIKTLFAVLLVFSGVSPIDGKTQRYFVVGCREEEGVIPTYGLKYQSQQ